MEKDKRLYSTEWSEEDHPRDGDGKFSKGGSDVSCENVAMKKESLIQKDPTVKPLSRQVDEVLSGKFMDSHVTISKSTPKMLQEIGIPNKPMLMTAKHTYLAINEKGKYTYPNDHYHGLGKELFLNISKLLERPVLAFKGKNKDEVIIAVDAWDKNKSPIIVPLKVNGKGNMNFIEINANVLKSVYGRDNYISYFQRNITNENLLILDYKKIRSLK